MKRLRAALLLALALVLLAAAPALATRWEYSGTVRNPAGQVLAGATVSVYTDSGYTTAATIWDAYSGGSSGGSVTADEYGRFIFWVDDGTYAATQQFYVRFTSGAATYDLGPIRIIHYVSTAGGWTDAGAYVRNATASDKVTVDQSGSYVPTYLLEVYSTGAGAIRITRAQASADGPRLVLRKTRASLAATNANDEIGKIEYVLRNTTPGDFIGARIVSYVVSPTASSEGANLAVETSTGGARAEALRIDGAKNLLVATTAAGASSVGTIQFGASTRPTTFSKPGLMAEAGDPQAFDTSGNVAALAPHNAMEIFKDWYAAHPGAPPWAFLMSNAYTGQEYAINMGAVLLAATTGQPAKQDDVWRLTSEAADLPDWEAQEDAAEAQHNSARAAAIAVLVDHGHSPDAARSQVQGPYQRRAMPAWLADRLARVQAARAERVAP